MRKSSKKVIPRGRRSELARLERAMAGAKHSVGPQIAWHYTTGEKFRMIIEDGYLRPTAIGMARPELPVLWFSLAPHWEPTANKAVLVDGVMKRCSREETMRLGGGLVRFGLERGRLIGWPLLASKARMTSSIRRKLEAARKRQGATPPEWMGSLAAVSVETLTIEVLDQKRNRWTNVQRSTLSTSEGDTKMDKLVKMRFTVKEGGKGTLYLVMEPADIDPPNDVQLHPRADLDMDDARELASLLNKSVERVRYK